MTINKNSEENKPDCSTAGKGFARTEDCHTASEDCCLPKGGFDNTDFGKQDEVVQEDTNCSTAGKGFARTEDCHTVAENCCLSKKGFDNTDFGK